MTMRLTGTREESLAVGPDLSRRDAQSRVASNIQDRPQEAGSSLDSYWTRALSAFETYVGTARAQELLEPDDDLR
jgi:hypothetical protein